MKILSGVVCEDVREEVAGKLTLLGYFGILPDVEIKVGEINKPLGRLMILFTIQGESEGPNDLIFEVLRPDQSLVRSITIEGVTVSANGLNVAAVNISGFQPTMTGKYTINLSNKDRTTFFSHTFGISVGEPDGLD